MDVKVEDVSLTCDTQLKVFNKEVSRLNGMDNDSKQEADDDMGYDPSDVAFIEWTALLTRTSINTDSLSQIHKAYSESLHDCFPEISRRDRDKYHNLEDDMIVKNIFNSGKHKDGVGMKILMFGVDVPTTQLQPIESTHGTHRTTSASRSPDPDVDEGETSAP
ncbi:hypothetical protein Tco_0285093 [Tanacetum coccineum]